jgi:hypothetical protein
MAFSAVADRESLIFDEMSWLRMWMCMISQAQRNPVLEAEPPEPPEKGSEGAPPDKADGAESEKRSEVVEHVGDKQPDPSHKLTKAQQADYHGKAQVTIQMIQSLSLAASRTRATEDGINLDDAQWKGSGLRAKLHQELISRAIKPLRDQGYRSPEELQLIGMSTKAQGEEKTIQNLQKTAEKERIGASGNTSPPPGGGSGGLAKEYVDQVLTQHTVNPEDAVTINGTVLVPLEKHPLVTVEQDYLAMLQARPGKPRRNCLLLLCF